MGWNICGVAINKNFENDINYLGQLLRGMNLRVGARQGKTFGGVDKMQSTSQRFDAYFTENGTFAWCNVYDIADFVIFGNKEYQKDTKIIIFTISETSMSFSFEYFEDGKSIRRLWEDWNDDLNDYKKNNKGEPLVEELEDKDRTSVVLSVVSKLIGTNFHEIPQDSPITRYMFC